MGIKIKMLTLRGGRWNYLVINGEEGNDDVIIVRVLHYSCKSQTGGGGEWEIEGLGLSLSL